MIVVRLPERCTTAKIFWPEAETASARGSLPKIGIVPTLAFVAASKTRTWSLADFKDAMRAKWNGEVIGGCVLHP